MYLQRFFFYFHKLYSFKLFLIRVHEKLREELRITKLKFLIENTWQNRHYLKVFLFRMFTLKAKTLNKLRLYLNIKLVLFIAGYTREVHVEADGSAVIGCGPDNFFECSEAILVISCLND